MAKIVVPLTTAQFLHQFSQEDGSISHRANTVYRQDGSKTLEQQILEFIQEHTDESNARTSGDNILTGLINQLQGAGYDGKSIATIVAELKDKYKPSYSYPSLSISINKTVLEVGEPFTPVITLSYTQRDAGAADFSKAGIEIDENTFPIDDALWNIAGNVITYVGQKVMYNPGALNLEVILAYAAGIVKQDTLFEEDYPTGQIGAGQAGSGEKTILWQFWSQIGSGASLPANAADYRTASSRQKDMAFPLMVAANALKEWIIIPEDFELDTVKDEGNLGADITSEYVLVNDAYSANDFDGDSFPAKLYIRSHAVAYGVIVEHAITLKYAE